MKNCLLMYILSSLVGCSSPTATIVTKEVSTQNEFAKPHNSIQEIKARDVDMLDDERDLLADGTDGCNPSPYSSGCTDTISNPKNLTPQQRLEISLKKNREKQDKRNKTAPITTSQKKPATNVVDDTQALLQDSSQIEMSNIPIGDFGPNWRPIQRRDQLEERNKTMVDKKIEDVRIKQEIALTNNMEKQKPILQPIEETPSDVLLKAVEKELVVDTKKEEKINSIQLKDRQLRYDITLLKIPNTNKLLPAEIIESSNIFMRSKYCSQSVVSKLRDMGIPIINSYKATNGELLYEVSVYPSTCLEKNSQSINEITDEAY